MALKFSSLESRTRGRICLALALPIMMLCVSLPAQQIRVYTSSMAGERLTEKPILQFEHSTAADVDFHIHDGVPNQTILGFGASFLEAGMICLNALNSSAQEQVLRALFDVDHGAGFSAMKSPVGATDFMSAGPWYSYDDVPGDVEMMHFSIERDLSANGVIPFIHRAKQYGSFAIESPMDYPPDWMLVNAGKALDQSVLPKYFPALARYYLRYIQEYEKSGVVIDYLSLFNEPGGFNGHSGYSGYTHITYQEIAELLRNHVVPLFAQHQMRTRFLLSEASTRELGYEGYRSILDDPATRNLVSGIAYHGYDFANFDKVAAMHERYPGLPLWMTEICHFAGYSPHTLMPRYDFEDGEFWGNQIFSELEAGASGWTYWNMILDQNGGPWLISPEHRDPAKNAQQPVVIIDREKKTITYTGLYYYLAHFSKFVRPGDVRVETAGARDGLRALTFKRSGGLMTAEIMNTAQEPLEPILEWRGRTVRARVPGRSITTLIWSSAQPPE